MKKRILPILFLLSLVISSCDLISQQVVGKIQNVMETNQPQLVVTKEVIVKTIEQVMVTTTPVPTPTPTAIPSFLGTPVQPDPALQRAVAVSLSALGTDFEIRLFTRAPNGDVMVWVRDKQYPATLLCGVPLYFPGLGSLLVLTTTHFYKAVNEFNTFSSASGCIAVSLSKGKAQVQKILEYYQGLYSALRSNKRFSSADGVNYYVQDFLIKQKNTPYPYELNMVLMPLMGDDLSKTSVEIDCPKNMGGPCQGDYRFHFTGLDISYENSNSRHVPLAYVRYFEQHAGPTELNLFSDRANKIQSSSPPGNLQIKQPLQIQEILSAWVCQNIWEQLVFNAAFTAGLGTTFPNMDTNVNYNNPSFLPLLSLSGVSHHYDVILAQNWTKLSSYFVGKTNEIPTAYFDTYIKYTREAIKNTYFEFNIFEEK